MDIKPNEGQVALELLDDDDGDDDTSPTPSNQPTVEDSYNEAIYAIVQGVGANVKLKKGQTVLARKYARNCLRVPNTDNVVICDASCVAAVISE